MIIIWGSIILEYKAQSFHSDNQCYELWAFCLTWTELTQSPEYINNRPALEPKSVGQNEVAPSPDTFQYKIQTGSQKVPNEVI